MGLLDGQIRKAIADGFRGKLLTGTLRKVTSTGRAANGDPTTSTADYAVQGFIETYSVFTIIAAGIPENDTKITLIAGLCGAEPSIGDRLYLSGKWFQVRKVDKDPAGATFECQSFQVQM